MISSCWLLYTCSHSHFLKDKTLSWLWWRWLCLNLSLITCCSFSSSRNWQPPKIGANWCIRTVYESLWRWIAVSWAYVILLVRNLAITWQIWKFWTYQEKRCKLKNKQGAWHLWNKNPLISLVLRTFKALCLFAFSWCDLKCHLYIHYDYCMCFW